MDYEPEQELLILHCGFTEMSLVLIDWPAKEVLKTDLELKVDEEFVKLKFNPLKINQLIIVKKKSIVKLILDRKDFLKSESNNFDQVKSSFIKQHSC
jgi:hypothetical protein